MDGQPSGTSVEDCLPRTRYAPFDPAVDNYFFSRTVLERQTAVPLEYAGWREEVLSWKTSCYLHSGLNPSFAYRLTGPDALRLLSDLSVNGYAKFQVGSIRHAIMCNDDGFIVAHGVLLRLAEDAFVSHYLGPWIDFNLHRGGYDATGEFVHDGFIFQVAGPRSLEVLEAAADECLHDLRFMRHRPGAIAGRPVRLLRVGMAGTLGYEVHGLQADVVAIYEAIMAAGAPFGIVKLGRTAYTMNHTENGFPQLFVHFPAPLHGEPGFPDYQRARGHSAPPMLLGGSMGDDLAARYRTPVEVGWGHMIRFDHAFRGRAALEAAVAGAPRRMVTLEWNTADVVDVYASQFAAGEPYPAMAWNHASQHHGRHQLVADRVLHGDRDVGVSSGRMYSYSYRRMISLCSLDAALAEEGTEVTVLWGEPGTRQKRIRATVARFPYLDEKRNEHHDLGDIPCRFPAPAA